MFFCQKNNFEINFPGTKCYFKTNYRVYVLNCIQYVKIQVKQEYVASQ